MGESKSSRLRTCSESKRGRQPDCLRRAIMGTPAYMAPEQARGVPVDSRADLFSMGCILYEMLTGKRPFSGSDTMAILTSLAIDTPPAPSQVNPHCSEFLSRLTMQLLEKQPERRADSAKLIGDALAKMADSTSNATVPPNRFNEIDNSYTTDQLPEIKPTLLPKMMPHWRRRVPIFAVGVWWVLAGIGYIAWSVVRTILRVTLILGRSAVRLVWSRLPR